MKETCKLSDLKLYRENGMYYLSATYCCENDREVYKIKVPKIYLITSDYPIIKEPIRSCGMPVDPTTINIGFGDCIMRKNDEGIYYSKKTIKEKVHDLTLSEIEKKLGYKIRVVSEKGE